VQGCAFRLVVQIAADFLALAMHLRTGLSAGKQLDESPSDRPARLHRTCSVEQRHLYIAPQIEQLREIGIALDTCCSLSLSQLYYFAQADYSAYSRTLDGDIARRL